MVFKGERNYIILLNEDFGRYIRLEIHTQILIYTVILRGVVINHLNQFNLMNMFTKTMF